MQHPAILALAAANNTTPEEVERSLQLIAQGDLHYDSPPVGIEEFVKSPYYLDAADRIYPKVMETLIDIYARGPWNEIVLTGGIGSAKTSIALLIQAYEVYLLSCYKNPHSIFELDETSEIEIVFQSLKSSLARDVDYKRFKAIIDMAPYFRNHFDYYRRIESEMRFPNRIIVKPAGGIESGTIGQNVIGGIIDEVNFMEVIEGSSKSRDGGTYDQAATLYNSIAMRRETRFMIAGKMPGQLCLVSSKQYPGEFTDRKIQDAKDPNRRIYIYDKRVWDIKPKGTYSGETFPVYIGDEGHKPQVLTPDYEPVYEPSKVVKVPIEFKYAFEDDILRALRDVAGVSTFAIHPYMINVEAVKSCFGKRESVLSLEECDLVSTRPLLDKSLIKDPKEPRFVHIDLGLTGDAAGVACGYVQGFTEVQRGKDHTESLPKVCFDFILRVVPPRNGEIEFSSIREILYGARAAGCPIKWVSLDSFQSVDTIQILRTQGFITGNRSMDKTTVPYDITKTAFYDQRIEAPAHVVAQRECTSLERDPRTNKVDHPPNGSKDCSDAMAGVTHGLTMKREIWVRHGVSTHNIPTSLAEAMAKGDNMAEGAQNAKAG